MKAIAIKQPWAQLVISGCKRFILSESFPFKHGETILVYASDYDAAADENGCFLAPCDRLMLENARLFGYLTEDELPTNAFIGCVKVVHYNIGESVTDFTCYLSDYLFIGDKKGPVEIGVDNPLSFNKPIPYDAPNTGMFFDTPITAQSLPETFAYRQFSGFLSQIFVPCSYAFFYDVADLDEYIYSINLLPNLDQDLSRLMNQSFPLPKGVLEHLTTLEKKHNLKFVCVPHDLTFMAGKHQVTFIIKKLEFEPSAIDSKTKVAVFHLSKIDD